MQRAAVLPAMESHAMHAPRGVQLSPRPAMPHTYDQPTACLVARATFWGQGPATGHLTCQNQPCGQLPEALSPQGPIFLLQGSHIA